MPIFYIAPSKNLKQSLPVLCNVLLVNKSGTQHTRNDVLYCICRIKNHQNALKLSVLYKCVDTIRSELYSYHFFIKGYMVLKCIQSYATESKKAQFKHQLICKRYNIQARPQEPTSAKSTERLIICTKVGKPVVTMMNGSLLIAVKIMHSANI